MERPLHCLEVIITELRSRRGQVLLALWRGARGFPTHTRLAAARLVLPIGGPTVVGRFVGLTQGCYAVAAVHDGNGNGKLDTTWFGVPKDGIGFSNNPKIRFGPPSFASCVVTVPPSGAHTTNTQVQVHMRYFLP